MEENTKSDPTVYELGYLIVPKVDEASLPAESDKIKKVITDAGASIIAEEMPHRERLAYTMRTKTISGSYDKFDEAYFGWVKFELDPGAVEKAKKTIESIPVVLRALLVTTIRENTYLGKHASRALSSVSDKRAPADGGALSEEKKDAVPATIEEMDKSIDEMVKEA